MWERFRGPQTTLVFPRVCDNVSLQGTVRSSVAFMSESICLVLYGRDQCLLDTRRRLLQEAGYPVWTARQIPDVFAIITEERVDVLILCHTLSQEEFTWAIAFAEDTKVVKWL